MSNAHYLSDDSGDTSSTTSTEPRKSKPRPARKVYYSGTKRKRHVDDSDSSDEEDGRPSIKLIRPRDFVAVFEISERLDEENWQDWKARAERVFINCCIAGYIDGSIPKPDAYYDPIGAQNWVKNDSWAQHVILHNVTNSQMVHVHSCTTSKEMYDTLISVHEAVGNRNMTVTTIILRSLRSTKAQEGTDIVAHLKAMKAHRDRINKFKNKNFHMPDLLFKCLITLSLPSSWNEFTHLYEGDPDETDPKKILSPDAYIRLLCEEYRLRQLRARQ